ncbi:lysophospholipid acyltransferase family protein [Synechococcus sp. UW140]|uniref:lysophospholipid acyltransferase family protein n=1 Tax=Synechococcus sp. UW140 TaxID=368503 RepID=UPI0018E0A022|nr:lysophospholipid acyltransferase family protein [Synechococcus sp. UW140]
MAYLFRSRVVVRLKQLQKALFFLLLVKPILSLIIGLHIRDQQRLPKRGPALVVANHNSHLDVFVLMSLFPLRMLSKLRAVAAADYFLSNPLLAWFSLNLVGILAIDRHPKRGRTDPLAPVEAALARNEIVILFPEGSRGDPEVMTPLRSGIAHLLQRHPELEATPVFLHGLGKALPKGEALLVPFFCDALVGEPIRWSGDKQQCLSQLMKTFKQLATELNAATQE